MSVVKRWGMVTCCFKYAELQEHFDGNTLENPKRYFIFFFCRRKQTRARFSLTCTAPSSLEPPKSLSRPLTPQTSKNDPLTLSSVLSTALAAFLRRVANCTDGAVESGQRSWRTRARADVRPDAMKHLKSKRTNEKWRREEMTLCPNVKARSFAHKEMKEDFRIYGGWSNFFLALIRSHLPTEEA